MAELDFASMYPSLMERYNISPETIRCRCCAPPGGRAMGFLDGSESPDLSRYEEMLREAADELLQLMAGPG